MIPTTTTNSVQTNTSAPKNFNIGNAGALIELLSTRLYSDKLGSFIREISTNAIDANIENNCPDTPITIDVGNDEGIMTVAIGDAGLGLSPELVKSKLSVLGVSTKDQSNNSHGGYGVGFLTVLAVSRKIEIHSHHGGYYYHYQITDANGELGIYLVKSNLSDGVGTIVKARVDRDYPVSPNIVRASDDIRYALAKFVFTTTVPPLLTSGDDRAFSADSLTRRICEFKASKLCGDADYSYYLSMRKASSHTNREYDCLRWSLKNYALVIMLGEVAYSVRNDVVMEGFEDWAQSHEVSFREQEMPGHRQASLLERNIRHYCERSQKTDFYPFFTEGQNVLILHFKIGELEVNTSREALAGSKANSRRIFDKLSLTYERIRSVVNNRLIYDTAAASGICHEFIADYADIAATWNIDSIQVDDVKIPVPFPDNSDIEWHGYWRAKCYIKSNKRTVIDNNDFDLTDEFGLNTTNPAELLAAILRIERQAGRPQIVLLEGFTKDKSIRRVLAKATPAGVKIDLNLAMVFINSTAEVLLNIPNIERWCDVHRFDIDPPKAKAPTFNKTVPTTLIWADLSDEECPFFSTRYRGRLDDDGQLPRLNWTQFQAQASTDKPIYYLSPGDFERDPYLRATWLFMREKLDVDIEELYIIGTTAREVLVDRGYTLHHGWTKIWPAAIDWLESELWPTVAKLGFAPNHWLSQEADVAVDHRHVEKIRLDFLRRILKLNFIDPQKVWLIEWLLANSALAAVVLNQRFYVPDVGYNEWLVFDLTLRKIARSSAANLDVRMPRRGADRDLIQTMRYLFADVLADLPILEGSRGLFCTNSGTTVEEYVAKAWYTDIESGALFRWRQGKNQKLT